MHISQNVKHLSYFPFGVVTLYAIITISLNLYLPQSYVYDEIIITHISRQPYHQLFDTVLSEPHPPGLYLLLSFIPTLNIQLTRIIFAVISSTLLMIALIYGYKTKVIEHFKLWPGLSLFLGAYGTVFSINLIKQDSITLPILIFILLITLKILKRKNNTIVTYLLLYLLLTIQLAFGYINYALSLALILISLIFGSEKRKQLPLLLSHLIIMSSYFYLYGIQQLQTNHGRLNWLVNQNNSPIKQITYFLTGENNNSVITDSLVLIFTWFLIALIPTVLTKLKYLIKRYKISWINVILLLFLGFTIIEKSFFFSQTRFILWFMFAISILAGFSLLKLIKKQILILIFLVIYSVIAIPNYIHIKVITTQAYSVLADFFTDPNINTPTGYLSDHPLTLVLTLEYNNNPHLFPVNIYHPNAFVGANTITKDHLLLDQSPPNFSREQYLDSLKQLGMTRYYFHTENVLNEAYVKDRELLSLMFNYCQTEIKSIDKLTTLYLFDKCTW